MNIPKLIHQTWSTNTLTEPLLNYRQSWINLNPNYINILHTDIDNDKLINDYYPEFKSIYYNFPYKIQKVDLIRLLYLYKFGGIYVDLDVECLKPIHNLFTNDTLVLEPRDNKLRIPFLISNYIMAFNKDSVFIKSVLKEILNNYSYTGNYKRDICASTGCLLLTKTYSKVIDKLTIKPIILDETFFTPYSHDLLLSSRDNNIKLPTPPLSTFGVHHYLGTWW
jgi:mannosyltransferase OCH1-like enzyme